MARVVQRRTNPTVIYLLVAAVILMLISTAVAVLFYMESEDQAKVIVEQKQTIDEFGTASDLDNPKIAAMRRQADRKPVIPRLQEEIEELASYVKPDQPTFAGARESWQQLRRTEKAEEYELTSDKGLVWLIEALRSQLGDSKSEEASLRREIAGLNETIESLRADISGLKKDNSERVEELKSEVLALENKLQGREEAHRQAVQTLEENYKARREQLNDTIREKNDVIDDMRDEYNKVVVQLDRARTIIRELKTPKLPEDANLPEGQRRTSFASAKRADGKILKVIEADDVCYIDLGEDQNVSVGLTFSVYSDKGIPTSGEGKAKILVTKVLEDSSECRIVEQERGQAVLKGDVIANVAFNQIRTPTFAVFGQFDLFGTERPSTEEAEIVESLIRRFGGKVVDEVSVKTDFVVLGVDPVVPPKPRDGTQDQGEYDRKLKYYRQYKEIEEKAKSLGIPIFNTTRFLAYTGYHPQKTQQY